MAKLITVKAVGKPNTAVLWEKNKAHPGGEVFLSTGHTAQVALTPAVQDRLRKGTLVKVSQKAAEDDSDTEEEEGEEEEANEEEGADKPELGASVTMLTDAGSGPAANVVATPVNAGETPPARGRGASAKK